MAELNWTEAQWQKVKDAVNEAFGKASVASAFLPMYGPLSASTEIVRNEQLTQVVGTPLTVRLNADHNAVNRRLVNLTVNVELSSEQVADETLSNALLAFRRAANILALEQDRVVFRGYIRDFPDQNSRAIVNQVDAQTGLADLAARRRRFQYLQGNDGQAVVAAVVAAIGRLEAGGQAPLLSSNPGPFACVLGNQLFNMAHDPSVAMVLPADRITPMLKGGPLLRSGMMEPNTGIVVSLAANAVDVVVGVPPTAQFILRQADARFLFRVYERFVLRIRDEVTVPVEGFRIQPDGQTLQDEIQRFQDLGL